MGTLVRGIFRHRLHEGRIAHIVRTRLRTLAGMLQIESVAPTPFPRVVQIEHRHHLATSQFLHQIVETSQDGIVVDTRLHL